MGHAINIASLQLHQSRTSAGSVNQGLLAKKVGNIDGRISGMAPREHRY